MSNIASIIAPQLPFLRRYARSLTGSQQSGDAYVAAVLETLVADPSSFPTDIDPRVALYRVFSRIWNSLDSNHRAGPVPAQKSMPLIDRRIEMLMPVPRQAFLLVAVERFSPDEAAAILEKPLAELEADLTEAGREIADQVATDVLIIEDEPLIAFDLEALVKGLGHEVTSIARTRGEAVAAIQQRRPGLILADIQLADGSSGLDAVRDILAGLEVPVIFITAYPEKVLTGLRPEPTFLIPKPFNPETVRTIISQALFFDVRARRSKAA
jgi:CheY-like chemotaxis protein/DNA-directed RNA polymerase specialized sigma24 family protein